MTQGGFWKGLLACAGRVSGAGPQKVLFSHVQVLCRSQHSQESQPSVTGSLDQAGSSTTPPDLLSTPYTVRRDSWESARSHITADQRTQAPTPTLTFQAGLAPGHPSPKCPQRTTCGPPRLMPGQPASASLGPTEQRALRGPARPVAPTLARPSHPPCCKQP